MDDDDDILLPVDNIEPSAALNDALNASASTSSEPVTLRHQVLPAEEGQRLDALVARVESRYSRVRLRQMITAGDIQVDGRRRKPAYTVKAGEIISGALQAPARDVQLGEDIPLDIIYEDDDLVAINKQHGMVVHPAKGHWNGTLTAALTHRYAQLSQVGGATRPGIVHRLARDTSGVIVIARNDAAHLHLARQFEQREVEKEYFAICRGKLDRDRDRIEQPIGPHPYQREKMAVRTEHPASRTASTFYEVQERFVGYAAVKVLPKTGRTHQIRVHLAHVGCPVCCDPLYAGQRQLSLGELRGGAPDETIVLDRLALHARRLQLRHPRDGRTLTFEAPITAELNSFLETLRRERPRKLD